MSLNYGVCKAIHCATYEEAATRPKLVKKSYVPVVSSFFFFSHSVSPATQCFAPQPAIATVDATLKANQLTSANANNDFMNKAPFRQANRTRQLLSCTG